MEHTESFHAPEERKEEILETLAEIPDTFETETSGYTDLLTGGEVMLHAEEIRELLEEGGSVIAIRDESGAPAAYFVIEKVGTSAEIAHVFANSAYEILPAHIESLFQKLAASGYESVSVHTTAEAAAPFEGTMQAGGEEDGLVHLTRNL